MQTPELQAGLKKVYELSIRLFTLDDVYKFATKPRVVKIMILKDLNMKLKQVEYYNSYADHLEKMISKFLLDLEDRLLELDGFGKDNYSEYISCFCQLMSKIVSLKNKESNTYCIDTVTLKDSMNELLGHFSSFID